MHLNFNNIVRLILGLSLLSCTKLVDIPLPNESPKIVLSSYINEGDSIQALVGLSLPFSQTGYPSLDSLSTVVLYENNVQVDTLHAQRIELYNEDNTRNYIYTSPYRARENRSYKIEVHRNKMTTAFASDFMPTKPEITALSIDTVRNMVSFRLKNTDPTNYYVFECFTKVDGTLNSILLTNLDPRMKVVNSGIIYSGSVTNGGTRHYLKNEDNDKSLLTFAYNPIPSLFSDSLFFRVSNISEDYYLHDLSRGNQETIIPIFNEPARLYTNVVNGYGLVGCSQSIQINFLH